MKRYREYRNGIAVVWSAVNQAWLVLWGHGRLENRSVLRVIPERSDLTNYLESLGVVS